MFCLVIPEGRTAPEVKFHHAIDCMLVFIDVFYLLVTYLLRAGIVVGFVVGVEVVKSSIFERFLF